MSTAWPFVPEFTGATNYKVIHLIRHAQGQHNAAVARTGDEEEYKNPAWTDSRLTEEGIAQARALRPEMEGVKIDIVFVSPLSRAILTGLTAIPEGPKFVVEDDIRERNGTHPCDKRRTKTELAADFPTVDFSPLTTEADESWSEEREPWEALVARAQRVLHKLSKRPERHIALVTHNDFLQALLLTDDSSALDLKLSDESLRVKFGNAQHLALILSWDQPGGEVTSGAAVVVDEGESTGLKDAGASAGAGNAKATPPGGEEVIATLQVAKVEPNPDAASPIDAVCGKDTGYSQLGVRVTGGSPTYTTTTA